MTDPSMKRYQSGNQYMTAQSDKQFEYGEYAEHCLHTVCMMPSQQARDLQRRMAAEWLKFADALLPDSGGRHHD
jgi:hypothetical protein